MIINFSLVCEGSSDASLVDYLKTILIECGATEASGDCPDLSLLPQEIGRDINSKSAAVIRLNSEINLLFVHRDIDNSTRAARIAEITQGTLHIPNNIAVVPILPNKMLETWLLADEALIKIAAENRGYQGNLDIPATRNLERIANTKLLLFEKLKQASEKTGRRLEKFNLYEARHYLIQNIDF